ncbi:DUF2637 domain-containing protein [Catenuloplanes atrovinosus]|uniref:DUF2637 domain-containing protein n=1 Tax=Catenuloplanes atrovinosus TaxID=137266 RepID=A0AAE3YJC1_9ACTN|nr:DUF2637 domain-containing protein [Catenuloplanes atrovinosus]MDR7273527.1 hypothetical protein [Catenuloplanes atrovinosus]
MTLPQLLRIRWAVRATLLLGVAASVVANVLHAVDNPISQAIAAWPPFALLLTVELISRVPVHRRSLAFIRMVATAAIAGIAAWISYWHMAGVAAKYGETGASAYLLPISVDGLIVVASICLIELGGRIADAQTAKRAAAEAAAAAATGVPAAGHVADEQHSLPVGPALQPAARSRPGTDTPHATGPDATHPGAITPPAGAATSRPDVTTASAGATASRADATASRPGADDEWPDDPDRLTDHDVPGIAALVPRPLTPSSTDAYPQLTTAADGRGPARGDGYATDEYRLVDAADRRRAAAMAGDRRDRDPLTTTGSQPMLASDVAAAVEAALSGRPVARGVRGGASPRSRAGISAASGSLAGRATVPDDGAPADVPATTGAAGTAQTDPATQRISPARSTARTSAATSTTRQTTTGRITARTAPATSATDTTGRATGSNAAGGTGRAGGNGEDLGASRHGTRPAATSTTMASTGQTSARPRRSAAETAALAADIEARNPGITEAAVADQLGITTRRLREVRRAADTLPA